MHEHMEYELPTQENTYKLIENGEPWALIVCNETLWHNALSSFMQQIREYVDEKRYENILYVDVADLSFGTKNNKRYMVLPNGMKVFEDGNLPIWTIFRVKGRREDFLMQQMGIPCYPSHESKTILDDKTIGYSLFTGVLNMPDCVYQAQNNLLDAMEESDFPYIMKTAIGAGGTGVRKADSFDEAREVIDELQIKEGINGTNGILSQKAVSDGSDVRVYLIGGKVYAAIKRQVSEGNWKANGEYSPIRLPFELVEEEKQNIERAAEMLNGEKGFISFDFLCDDDGKLTLCEGNSNPGIDDIATVFPDNTLLEDYIDMLNSLH